MLVVDVYALYEYLSTYVVCCLFHLFRFQHAYDKSIRYKLYAFLTIINAKKHSLSHQLTAQLHIENSKNKKMVITLLQHIA